MVNKMNMKKICILAVLIIMLGFSIQSASAAQSSVDNVKATTQEALNNASDMANQTAQDVNNTLGPIQDILNSINSVLNTLSSIAQNIQQIFGGGQ